MDFELSIPAAEQIEWTTELLKTCKRLGIDYYHGTAEERAFCEKVARENYESSKVLKGETEQHM